MSHSHDEERSAALDAFRRYTQAFQTLAPEKVAPHFHQPALQVTPDGVLALPDGGLAGILTKSQQSRHNLLFVLVNFSPRNLRFQSF
jgi:hypothetical protein